MATKLIPDLATEESVFLQLTRLVDNKEWVEAKELITFMIQEDQPKIVHQMMCYYREYVCENCLGDGFTIEGEFGNEYEKKCDCQLS